MTFTYDSHYDQLMHMSTKQFFNHYSCMQLNMKHNTMTPEHIQAMKDVYPFQFKRADEEYKFEKEQEALRLHAEKLAAAERLEALAGAANCDYESDEDPRIVAGTHERVFERQKCGGKGQTVLVASIVLIE